MDENEKILEGFAESLTEDQMQILADRLLPYVMRKMTLRSQKTVLGTQGEFFQKMKLIEITTTGNEQDVNNPLKEIPEGCLLLEPNPDAKLKITAKTKHKITFNSAEAGHKIYLYVF